MDPKETGARYDQLATFWRDNTPDFYGLSQLERALRFTSRRGAALDVGCGSQGRFLHALSRAGFSVEGVDISPRMIALARESTPQARFHTADICEWELPGTYDWISAWDSTFHLPIENQEPVLRKLCAGLNPGGVILFTCGGGAAGEITGSFAGQTFGYSTLGMEEFVRILASAGCFCRHVEYDQFPEIHVVVVGQKP